MGIYFLALAGAVMAFAVPASDAAARPMGPALQQQPLLQQVQLVCNANGCFDAQNGRRITASFCNRQGCYPTNGVNSGMTQAGPRNYGQYYASPPAHYGYPVPPQQYPYPLPTPQPEREHRNH